MRKATFSRSSALAGGIVGAALLLLAAGQAQAQTVYSEDFNDSAFAGSLDEDTSTDRWASVSIYAPADVDGWTFIGNVFWTKNLNDTSDGAIWLNESGPTWAITTLTGLTVGETYTVSFLQWGDNEPGNGYAGLVDVGGTVTDDSYSGGSQILRYPGVDGAAGSNPGVTQTATFDATSDDEILAFGQASSTNASPVIDDVTVDGSAVPEPATWTIIGMALFSLAALRRGRRAG